MFISTVLLASLAKPSRLPKDPPSGPQLKRLLVASSTPLAFGAFAPAVQLCGPLNDAQAILLQCGTYSVATADVAAVRAVRERSIRVGGRTWRAGVELGLWITAAATLESLGLQRTTATRAGFLVRLSTVIVPTAECWMRRTWLPKRLLAAVLLSAVGVAFIMASSPAGASVRQATVLGDGLVALSAVLYSAHILRLSAIVRDRRGETPISPWPLATAKAATQLVCSAAALGIACLSGAARSQLSPLPSRLGPVVLFTGTVACSYPMWAQAYSQQTVSPSVASVIYSTAPAFNALIAFVLLGQGLTPLGVLGAALMMGGMLTSVLE